MLYMLWQRIVEPMDREDLAEKWRLAGPDRAPAEHREAGSRLIATVRGWCFGQTVAVADTVERFWENPELRAERLRAVGLVRDQP